MNQAIPLMRRVAAAVLRLAAHLLQPNRLGWVRAMEAELDHMGRDRDALWWAIGCVFAAVKERVYTMLTSKLSRLLVCLLVCAEMLVCFVPLTVGWLDAIAGRSGVARLSADVIDRYFLHTHGGDFALATMIAGALMLATRVAVEGRLGALEFGAAGGFDFWSGVLLLSVLPAFGAAHLYHLTSRVMYGRFVPR